MFRNLKTYFVSGLLALLPLVLTVFVVGWLVKMTDQFIVNPLFHGVFRVVPLAIDPGFRTLLVKVVIAIVVLIFVCLLGWAAQILFFRTVSNTWERLLTSIPLFNRIYLAIKEIAQAFFGDKTGVFKRVVYVEYPRKGIYAMAFIVSEKHWDINDRLKKDTVNVLVPAPPNPATGFFFAVPKNEIIESKLTVEQGIKLVISFGAAVPVNGKQKL